MDWTFASKELDKTLLSTAVKEREMAGRKMSYVEGWHVIAEANRIFGFENWTRETLSMSETSREIVTLKGKSGDYQQWRVSYLAKVRITVAGVAREGTGYGSGMGKPEALGDAIESAAKEAETDAMKRAFMTFGNPFGLALYDKTQENVEKVEPERKPDVPSRFLELKDALGKIMDQSSLDAWIGNVKDAINKGQVTLSEKATLSNLLDARRAFLAQAPSEAAA
jgi:DNA repair and recombination protein RAD52